MDSMGMNMTGSSNMTSSNNDSMGMDSMMMMKSYLHFTPGDTILFNTIAPASPGAIFATCLIFFLISIGDRYLRAVCRGVERRFKKRSALPHRPHLMAINDYRIPRAAHLNTYYHFSNATDANVGSTDVHADKSAVTEAPTQAAGPSQFILSQELARGFLAGLQTTLHYLLMLVVMCVSSFHCFPSTFTNSLFSIGRSTLRTSSASSLVWS
jgi:copper transporter 1